MAHYFELLDSNAMCIFISLPISLHFTFPNASKYYANVELGIDRIEIDDTCFALLLHLDSAIFEEKKLDTAVERREKNVRKVLS